MQMLPRSISVLLRENLNCFPIFKDGWFFLSLIKFFRFLPVVKLPISPKNHLILFTFIQRGKVFIPATKVRSTQNPVILFTKCV